MNRRKNIFIDFDGVISDTNTLKEKNINEAYKYIFGEYNSEFVDFFTRNNGVPREIKLKQYFDSPKVEGQILKQYFLLNENLLDANLASGFLDYLKINNESHIYILSGGDKNEISSFLVKNNILHFFNEIFTGPKTKSENLSGCTLSSNDIFIGDSRHDYLVAREYNLNFIFMTDFSQESQPYSFIDNPVVITKNFETLVNEGK
ncbi:HAD family hydrolase [bacterium]|nr:HAD family hydrolase [bacterium]